MIFHQILTKYRNPTTVLTGKMASKTHWSVNLVEVMGRDVWAKYDSFSVRLDQFIASLANFRLAANDSLLIMKISRFNFLHPTYKYDVKSKANSHACDILAVNIPTSTAVNLFLPQNTRVFTIKKGAPEIVITIELIRLVDGLAAQYGAVDKFPSCAYNFSITGIQE